MPPLVVSRLSTSGSPVVALRPFGQPASPSSFFAASSGLRRGRPSIQSYTTGKNRDLLSDPIVTQRDGRYVVPLKAGVAGSSVPSKLLSIFSAGRPVVLAAEAGSAADAVVREAGGGWVVEPGDPQALAAALTAALADPAGRAERGASALAWALDHAGTDRMALGWEAVLAEAVDIHQTRKAAP